jgi:thiosulfate/3-mercaptopyruvate sulfurtransferase
VKPRVLGWILAAATVLVAADLTLVAPPDLAKQLTSSPSRPAILYVGPAVMYRSKHIPNAVYAGEGRASQGIALLKDAVAKLAKDREIVIYCGCCPWDHCPNIKPAMAALKGWGYTRVKALDLPMNFKADWIDKGYPVQ